MLATRDPRRPVIAMSRSGNPRRVIPALDEHTGVLLMQNEVAELAHKPQILEMLLQQTMCNHYMQLYPPPLYVGGFGG